MGNAKNICYDVFLKDFGPESERTPGWARYCNSFWGKCLFKKNDLKIEANVSARL